MAELIKFARVSSVLTKRVLSAPAALLATMKRNPNCTVLVTIMVWLGFALVIFYLRRSHLLVSFDGAYMFDLARRQFEWRLPVSSASIDWFQGLGDVYFAVNFRLVPAFIVGSLFGVNTAAKVTIYGIVLCELMVSIVLFGLSLRASRAVSVAAALTTCLTFLPFANPTLIYGIMSVTPHLGSLISGALLAAAAFLQFGRRSWRADLRYSLIVLGLLTWFVLVSITFTLLALPFLLLCAVSGVIAAGGREERICKLCLLAAAGGLVIACGPAVYLTSTILDTAAVNFPSELANNRASFHFASILFHWNGIASTGPVLTVSGIAGAATVAFDRSRPTLRIFAITLLTYLATRLTFAVLVIVFDFWRGPGALYFEFFVIPLYAIFAAIFWGMVLEQLWRRSGWTRLTSAEIQFNLFAAAIVIMLLLAIFTSRTDYGFHYPPAPTPITNILSRESALEPGSIFRGRTANLVGRSVDHPVVWADLIFADFAVAQNVGNELRLVGLNYFGVPTLLEYTPTITPFLYALTSRLLALPGDRQIRNVIVMRDFEPRILTMLGVRFVITDRNYYGPARLVTSMPTNGRTLLLYELASPNLGNYSPTVVSAGVTAATILTRLRDPNFDPQREIIADIQGGTGKLVAARNARLIFDGASLIVQADSDGRSILLLPLEFSRCLEVRAVTGDVPALFRANLAETGVLFSGHVNAALSIRTGPFLHPACRLWDFLEARALKIGEVPPREPLARAAGG